MSRDWTEDELLSKLLAGKRDLRATRQAMTLRDKVREVVELQKVYVSTVGRRRKLTELEVVWALES